MQSNQGFVAIYLIGPQGTGKSWTANRLYKKKMNPNDTTEIDDDLDDKDQKFRERFDPQGRMLKTKEFEPNIRDYLQAEQIDNFFLIDTIGLGSFTDKARRDQPKIYLDPKYYIKEITIKIYVFVSPHDYVLAEDLELDMQHFSAYCKPENILVFLNKRNPQVKEQRCQQVKETYIKNQHYFRKDGLCSDIKELIIKIHEIVSGKQ